MKLVLLGAPGAGKGTQSTNLSVRLGVPHISTGDIFRANIRENTPLGVEASSYISKGLLVPDELTIGMVADRLSQPDCENGYILDGFPRTLAQADALDKLVKLTAAVNIHVDDEVIVGRMSGRRVCPDCGEPYHIEYKAPAVDGVCDRCGGKLIVRADDKPETVKNRLKVYHDQTAPLIGYYGDKGLLVTVDGTLAPEQVTEAILAALAERE